MTDSIEDVFETFKDQIVRAYFVKQTDDNREHVLTCLVKGVNLTFDYETQELYTELSDFPVKMWQDRVDVYIEKTRLIPDETGRYGTITNFAEEADTQAGRVRELEEEVKSLRKHIANLKGYE